ncbi:Aminopeptidase N [compost metagenome]
MQNDPDSFNRREMGQKMAMRVISNLIKQASHNEPLKAPTAFLAAFKGLINDQTLDPAFKAKMLQLPSLAVIAQEESVLDAVAFDKAYKFLRQSIAAENKEALLGIYKKFHNVEPKSRDPKVFGHRQLKNMALGYLAELNTADMMDLIYSQYTTAQNMTDKIAALSMLADSESPLRDKALTNFHDTWKEDKLVMNKWLQVQAITTRKNALDDIKALTQHEAFNINNPNNVYALLRAFGGNLVSFNNPAVNAYKFYADRIIEIDAKNPQVAARLCAAFNFTEKLNPEMKAKALTEIRRIVEVPGLSKNSRELLESALKH